MPIYPFGSKKALLQKAPNFGNKSNFSTGKSSENITAWEVWNTRVRRKYSAYSKIYNDQTTLVLRTHNPLAEELESDDKVTWEGRVYKVQEAKPVETPYNVRSIDYEIILG